MERPATRAERQEQTRRALVLAAREVFARDGFHGARLERIAAEAGFSKGAVYSNFDGKADLFLAVMDLNLEAVARDAEHEPAGHQDDLAEPESDAHDGHGPDDPEQAELLAAMRGFALATLEFIAAAARDDALRAALATRIHGMLGGYYVPYAQQHRAAEDPLAVEELAMLMAAIDQGAALLTVSGTTAMDQRLLRTGLARLVAAGRLGDVGDAVGPGGGRDDDPALHRTDVQQRIADSIRD